MIFARLWLQSQLCDHFLLNFFFFFDGRPDRPVVVIWSLLMLLIGTVGCKAESWRAEVVMSLCLHANLLLCSAQQHCSPAPSSLPTLVDAFITPSPDDHHADDDDDDDNTLLPHFSHLRPSDDKTLPSSYYFTILSSPFSDPSQLLNCSFTCTSDPDCHARITLTSLRTPWTCRPSSGSWTLDNTKSLGSMWRTSG